MTPETFLDGKVQLYRGDCLEILPLLPENSVDAVCCDPPYHLTSITKRFGKPGSAPCQYGRDGAYARQSRGFMQKVWDGGDIAFRPDTWEKVLRVLKPGGYLLAFGGDRTQHRVACAIEDAGADIRHTLIWTFGSGFPKSRNVGADIAVLDPDQAERWAGWGTALKPAAEFICMARKPLSESSIASNVLKHGTGAINIDGCRIAKAADDRHEYGVSGDEPSKAGGGVALGLMDRVAYEPNKAGRWPANLIHDGSEEVLEGFPESADTHKETERSGSGLSYFNGGEAKSNIGQRSYVDSSSSAARFFYTAKADQEDRLGSKHPTVKPLDLIQYLIRLVTPRGGTLLDPFAGTGTAGEAAWREGFRSILIEREPEYQADIVKRMGLCLAGPDQRRAASVKQIPPDDLPMFGGIV